MTHENIQEQVDRGKREDDPNTGLDRHEHGEVCLAVRNENPVVEKKDRELDEEYPCKVDGYGGIEPLVK